AMELLEQIEAYLARTRTPPSKFGRMAVGDPRFVDDLRAGRRPRRKTQERVMRYLQSQAVCIMVAAGSADRRDPLPAWRFP
ncbi:MAG: hypothetical protein C0511_17735, partial [Hyphomicrobium sp.]|nr:hypothetical protein [Hyphomicrobium sp.]